MAEIVRMPALSDTMTEGTLIAWHKEVGEKVAVGELLAEIETDKAVMEFQSLYKGTLLHIGIEEGSVVPVDAIIAVIGKEGEDVAALLKEAQSQNAEGEKEEASEPETAPQSSTPEAPKEQSSSAADDPTRLKASPLAKAMAKDEGVDLGSIEGSGEDGRIIKRDVEAALQARQEQAAPSPQAAPVKVPEAQGEYEDVPLSQMRKTIARRLGESKFSAPHFYLNIEVKMDKLMALRKQLKSLSDTPISFNDLVVKAAAKALESHPSINASWLGDKIRYYKYVNIGVAVAIDEGLVVPVIRNSNTKALSSIAKEIREYAELARERKLAAEDMQGSTFTISNLGMFGIDSFTAIINPPDACILAVGAIKPRLAFNANKEVVEEQIMKLTLSCDHRLVDGASGAKFLQTLQGILEEPMRLLV